MPNLPTLGVAIVAFNSADVILPCLHSLVASRDVKLRIVVTDNASADSTVDLIRDWARDHVATNPDQYFEELPAGTTEMSGAAITLLRSEFNGGYAYGVNVALELLLRDPEIDLFWVLNPDCEVSADTAASYARHGADGRFSLMSGRTVYCEDPSRIQADGGRVNRWTGVCSSVNSGAAIGTTRLPDPQSIDYVTGGNLVASRAFIEAAGLMPEDYFLYYEEVDWAMRRGTLPLRLADDAVVHHHVGTAIGSGSAGRRASPLSDYFNYRNRIRFLSRFRPWCIPFGLAHAAAKAAQLALQGARAEAWAAFAGAFGLPPPAEVRARIAPGKARELAFGNPQ